jgi:alpha-tubulin suppressor-like RCC1 family protein
VEQLAAGEVFSCARLSDGSVRCWGRGDAKPKPVPELTKATSISVGSELACAVLADGSARCWGMAERGQLGDGTTNTITTIPTKVYGLSSARQITIGHNHACALLEDGTVQCWGENIYGQVGDGTTTERLVPTPVAELSNIVEVSAGFWHTCARMESGKIFCWGMLESGREAASTTPVAWGNGVLAATVRAGRRTTCAILPDRTVSCSDSLLGSAPAVPVPGLADIETIALGDTHACALDGSTSSIWCWGSNLYGEVGDGTLVQRSIPVRASFAAATSLAAGVGYTLVIAGTRVIGWGRNEAGELGIGKLTPNELSPVAVVW